MKERQASGAECVAGLSAGRHCLLVDCCTGNVLPALLLLRVPLRSEWYGVPFCMCSLPTHAVGSHEPMEEEFELPGVGSIG